MKKATKRQLMLCLLCYALALLLWLGAAGLRLAVDSASLPAPRSLEPQDFTALSGIWVADNWASGDRRLVTQDADPQMILEFGDEGLPLAVLEVRAESSYGPPAGPGGTHLYYTTGPRQSFSERHKLWAEAGLAGSWRFDLGGRRVYALRLDLGSAGGVTWQYDAVVLNAEKPPYAYFVPDARAVFLLLFAPPLAVTMLWEAAALLSPWFARRRLARKGLKGA